MPPFWQTNGWLTGWLFLAACRRLLPEPDGPGLLASGSPPPPWRLPPFAYGICRTQAY